MKVCDDQTLLATETEAEAADASEIRDRREKKRIFFLGGAFVVLACAAVVLVPDSSVMAGRTQRGRVPQQATVRADFGGLAVFNEEGACAAAGEGCAESKCCSGPGMQCYAKDENWAECRATCAQGPDPRGPDNNPWSCEKLGERAKGEAPVCSKTGEDCSESQCCEESGMQCYGKADGYATCKVDCLKGLNLEDMDPTKWSCELMGPRTPDVAPWVWSKCAATNGDCSKSQCCNTPGMQCYMKDMYYGTCMESCDPNAPATTGWSCDTRGQRLPNPAPKPSPTAGKPAKWVADYCAKEGEDCRESTCCVDGGFTCFEKDHSAGRCKASCEPGPDLYDTDGQDWTCKALGPRTPGLGLEPWEASKNVSDWVSDKCAEEWSENCVKSHCCKKPGDKCFQKNSGWAACMPDCVPGPHKGDDTGGDWTCEELGPRTHRAYPSIFCFSVVQPQGYEAPLMKAQIPTGHGIWACDKFSVFSTKEFVIGEVPGHGEVKTATFVPAAVGRSKDYTAANSELFMHVWDSVSKQGLWRLTDFTVKVDPDAVLLPTRLRKHLDQFTGAYGYIVNCAKPFMPEGPMMFGALEAFTRSAMEIYFAKAKDCATGLPWQQWGEDLYMGKCLEKLGVKRLNDFTIYSDGVCRGVDCADPDAAAFHPKKDIGSWMACLEQSHNPHPRLTTDAPQWFKDYMKSYAR